MARRGEACWMGRRSSGSESCSFMGRGCSVKLRFGEWGRMDIYIHALLYLDGWGVVVLALRDCAEKLPLLE